MLGAAGSKLRNLPKIREERLTATLSRNSSLASGLFVREPAVLSLVQRACMAASLLPRCSPCASFGVLRPGAGTRTRRNLTIRAVVVEVPTQYSKVGRLSMAAQQLNLTRRGMQPCFIESLEDNLCGTMQVVPKGDLVLAKVAEAEDKTLGGVLLPDSAQKKPTSGAGIVVTCAYR